MVPNGYFQPGIFKKIFLCDLVMEMLSDRIGSKVKGKKMQNAKHLNLLIHKPSEGLSSTKNYDVIKCELSIYHSAETRSLLL